VSHQGKTSSCHSLIKYFATRRDRDDASEVSGMAGWRKNWWREAGFAKPILDPPLSFFMEGTLVDTLLEICNGSIEFVSFLVGVSDSVKP